MPNSETHPFDRLFPTTEFFRPQALLATLCGLLGSLTLLKQLFLAYLLFGLLAYGGRLTLILEERAAFEQRFAGAVPPPTSTAGDALRFDDSGVLPLAWHSRATPLGGQLTTAAFRQVPALRSNTSALILLVLSIALLQLVRLLFDSLQRRMHLRHAMDVITQLRLAMHRQALRLGPSDLEGKSTQRTLQLFAEEIDRLRDGVVRWSTVLARDPLRTLLLLLLVVATEPLLALLCLVPLAGCWGLAHFIRRRSETQRKLSLALADQDQRILTEALTKTQLVKSFGMESFEQQQFERSLQRYQAQTTAALQAGRNSRALVHVLWTLVVAGTAFLAGYRAFQTGLPFSALLLMSACLVAAWYPLQRIWALFDEHERTRDAAGHIQAWLDVRPEVEQVVGAKFLQPLSRVCEFQNVSYSSNGRHLLENVSLKLPAGKAIAIVATDPLEARALAFMLPRFIEPQNGRVLFDGEEIDWVTLESLRAETIFVSGQEPYLTGTIHENLSGGGQFAMADLTDAAKIAHAHAFIEKLPQGYETVIGEHGEQLDAGQAFRLGLARAILRKPAVLIIEEPPATIDEETKLALDDAYTRISAKRTVIFLPNRMSTIRRADLLVFLHKGRVVNAGPRESIVAASALYRHWEYSRFNEFRHEFEAP